MNKGESDSASEITPGAAMVRVLHNHIHFFSLFRDKEAALTCHTVEGLVLSAPAYALLFTRDFDPLLFFEENNHEEEKAL